MYCGRVARSSKSFWSRLLLITKPNLHIFSLSLPLKMCSRQTCPYCKKSVTSGISCSNCGSLLHKSCADRYSTDKSGIFKCCQGTRPISPSLLKVVNLLDQQADSFLLLDAIQENPLQDSLEPGTLPRTTSVASGSTDQAAGLSNPLINLERGSTECFPIADQQQYIIE